MDKFTLFELHVHDGVELSATNTAPAIGRSKADDEEYEELAEYVDDGDADGDERDGDDDASGRGMTPLKLLVSVVAIAVLAYAVRRFRGGDAELEIAELDDLTEGDAYDEEEAEH